MYTANPSEGERFYMRLLLTHVRGPTTFEDLRTVDAVECATFQEACLRHGLLQDDSHLDAAMSEVAHTATASQLRHLFAAILTHSAPSDPARL